MGQDRIHKGHRSDAMVRIVEAREKYENRADGRVRQRFMEMPDGTWQWVRIPLEHPLPEKSAVNPTEIGEASCPNSDGS